MVTSMRAIHGCRVADVEVFGGRRARQRPGEMDVVLGHHNQARGN
jgi:hypothetical protein